MLVPVASGYPREELLRMVRPSLIDPRFTGDPWIVDGQNGTFALCLGDYCLAGIRGVTFDWWNTQPDESSRPGKNVDWESTALIASTMGEAMKDSNAAISRIGLEWVQAAHDTNSAPFLREALSTGTLEAALLERGTHRESKFRLLKPSETDAATAEYR